MSGVSMDQISDIICEMKDLVEKNEPLARQILTENPVLTRALFKAQDMFGMFPPPMPTTQPRPQPSVPAFSHQHHSHMGGIVHSGSPQIHHHLQPSNVMPPPSMRPSFRQEPLPSQSHYQIGNSSLVGELGTQMGGGRAQPLTDSDQMGSSPIISEVEKAFMQQVINVTPDQLNLLPPEQKDQLMLLKQMLLSRQ